MMVEWLKKVFRVKPKKQPRVKMYSEIKFEQIDGPPFDYDELYRDNPLPKEEPKET
ncbi:MAG: hypothetical protein HAW66_00330 [Shewanella sp.]|nr:hypothetical protein [Shewanella sp.]